MLNRRTLFAAAAVAAILPGAAALAQSAPSELVLAIIPAENSSGTSDRNQPLADYLTKETGVKTTLRIAADYAAVIEGMRNKQIHIGVYGPSSYARAHKVSGGNVVAFSTEKSKTGAVGYYSVIYVKKDSPIQSLKDLQGRKLGLVEPNSTSGNFAPRYFLNKEGVDVEKYFSAAIFTGSHENAVMAVQNGTVDAAANWWNAEGDSNLSRMGNKGMVKADDFRIVWKSGLLAGSPIAYLNDLPADLKKKIADAFNMMATKNPELVAKLTDGQAQGYVPVSHKDYVDQEQMNDFVDALRRKSS